MNEEDNERERESLQHNAERIVRSEGYDFSKNMLYVHDRLEELPKLFKQRCQARPEFQPSLSTSASLPRQSENTKLGSN